MIFKNTYSPLNQLDPPVRRIGFNLGFLPTFNNQLYTRYYGVHVTKDSISVVI
jgi:hypothetical protein